MNRRYYLWLFVIVMVTSLWRVLFHVQVKTDITAFMPEARTQSQSLLMQQLENGAAARLWILALSNASEEKLAMASRAIAQHAAQSALISEVWNGQQSLSPTLRKRLFEYRYLLSDRIRQGSYSATGLRKIFEELLQMLRTPFSTFSKTLAARDPGGEGLYVLDALQEQSSTLVTRQGLWFSKDDGQALLLLQSDASGSDLDAQQLLYDQLQNRLLQIKSVPGAEDLQLMLGGVPIISLQTRMKIRDASRRLSIAATVFMLLFMFAVYRSLGKVLLTALPLLSGALVAASLVSWWFGSIHGITLAFGIILLGVAVDYPVHILSHQRAGEPLPQTVKRIRGTLMLGVLSSVLGFSAMLWTDFSGLAQLGLFAVTGLLMAAWVSIYIIPFWTNIKPTDTYKIPSLSLQPLSLRWIGLLVMGLVVMSVIALSGNAIWSKDIQALSPMSEETRQTDQQMRGLVGAADPGAVLLVVADSVQHLLEKQERLTALLQQAIKQGYVKSVAYAARILPSRERQLQRRGWIPQRSVLVQSLEQALRDLPFRVGGFQEFIDDLQTTRQLPPLLPRDFQDTLLGLKLQGLMQHHGKDYVGVVTLKGVRQIEDLRRLLDADAEEGIWLLDIPQATSQLVDGFREAVVIKVILALVLIALLVWLWLRDAKRWSRVMLPVLLSMWIAGISVLLGGGGLNIFHLVSLLLVAGIGLDYALFFSRGTDDTEDVRHTWQALSVCALSTIVVFLLLAFSAIPVLQAIGVTVATGAASAFLLSWLIASRKMTLPIESKENR